METTYSIDIQIQLKGFPGQTLVLYDIKGKNKKLNSFFMLCNRMKSNKNACKPSGNTRKGNLVPAEQQLTITQKTVSQELS